VRAVQDLVFLTQRIPYPPDKGDKIRSFHILQHLAKRYRIHLGCFIDDPHDERHVPRLKEYCASVLCVPIRKPVALARGLAHMARGKSLSEGYFKDPRMARWVDSTVARTAPKNVFVFCSSMAPYAFAYRKKCTTVMDMVDVDSEKWRAYAEGAPWPLRLLYAREAKAMLALEARAVLSFDRSFLASPAELRLFLSRAPQCAGRVGEFLNGVDAGYFDPHLTFDNPYSDGTDAVAFTGAMDYEPNVRAVVWYAHNVFAEIRRKKPRSEFWIVGANPSPHVAALARIDGIHVTGRVPDMRPYLRHADCVVAPLQIARGLQNKVLEAMAMDRTVVATAAAWQGLTSVPGKELFLAESSAEFAAAVLDVLEGKRRAEGARARVLADHQWSGNLDVLLEQFGPEAKGASIVQPGGRICDRVTP